MDRFDEQALEKANDSWARVELWRWQYGELPGADDMRPLCVSSGLRGMARAIRTGGIRNFPSAAGVAAALEYAAKLLGKDATPPRTNDATTGQAPRSEDY